MTSAGFSRFGLLGVTFMPKTTVASRILLVVPLHTSLLRVRSCFRKRVFTASCTDAQGSLMTRILRSALLALLAVSVAGCVFHRVEVTPMKPPDQTSIVGPLKAHLRDGSTVVYAPGVVVTVMGETLRGAGMRYDYAITEAVKVERVPLDVVVGMERFETKVNRSTTILASIGGAWLVWGASVSLLMWAAGGP